MEPEDGTSFVDAEGVAGIGTLIPSRLGPIWVMSGAGSGALPTTAIPCCESGLGVTESGTDWVGPIDPRRRTSCDISDRTRRVYRGAAIPSSARTADASPDQTNMVIIGRTTGARLPLNPHRGCGRLRSLMNAS